MINNIIALGMEKPKPDRYLNSKLIDELEDIKPSNGCNQEGHHVVFANYKIDKSSSYFDLKPGICSCGIYWKTLANGPESKLKEFYMKTEKTSVN